MLTLIILIFISEIFVDWIKHGFITKFNGISPDEYQKYCSVLANDLITGNNAVVSVYFSIELSQFYSFVHLFIRLSLNIRILFPVVLVSPLFHWHAS